MKRPWRVFGIFCLTLIAGLAVISMFRVPAAQAQVACVQLIQNSGFEDNSAWLLGTAPQLPEYVTYAKHSGNRSLAMGIVKGLSQLSYSSARQTVTIPPTADTTTLTFWFNAMMTPPIRGQYMELVLLAPDGTVLEKPWYSQNDSRIWNQMSFDLSRWRGRTVQIYFNVYNDGLGGTAGMFLDDVTLVACSGSATPPHVHPHADRPASLDLDPHTDPHADRPAGMDLNPHADSDGNRPARLDFHADGVVLDAYSWLLDADALVLDAHPRLFDADTVVLDAHARQWHAHAVVLDANPDAGYAHSRTASGHGVAEQLYRRGEEWSIRLRILRLVSVGQSSAGATGRRAGAQPALCAPAWHADPADQQLFIRAAVRDHPARHNGDTPVLDVDVGAAESGRRPPGGDPAGA